MKQIGGVCQVKVADLAARPSELEARQVCSRRVMVVAEVHLQFPWHFRKRNSYPIHIPSRFFFLLTSTLLRIPPLVSTNINDTNEQDIAISFDRFHDSKAGLSTADRGELQASSLGMCDADDPNWKSNRQVPLAHGEDVSETDLRSLLHLNHLKTGGLHPSSSSQLCSNTIRIQQLTATNVVGFRN